MELHRIADKLMEEVDMLDMMLASENESYQHLQIAVAQTKRVRRECNMLLKSLAILRDDLQP